ncbi:MAG: D-xylose ABC transporter ATP-binding protein [Acidobacteria bacterium 13_1_40CM_65_14]|nr:MAG: D-xylose ABC transporter ATP-binding protein [Acidobacteria bacterium 13_1_40CM_65_14]
MSLLLEADSITKSFAGVRALTRVTFTLAAGEVHALVGENGAGKSTLIKVITGAETPDAGTLAIAGHAVTRMDPALSRSLGIRAIYQQPSLFPHLTVAENVALALESGRAWRRVDWGARTRTAAALLERIGAPLDPDRLVESLSMPEQQIVEIAKAIGANAKILIMDEPTASLSAREVDYLFAVITRLRGEGTGVVYISHRLEEVFTVADRITVLRDGEVIATSPRADLDRAELIRLMVGRELAAVFPKRAVPLGPVALDVRHLRSRDAGLDDISLDVRRGEILGLAGLVGSGRTELAETIFGLRSIDGGEVLVNGARARIGSPADAIALGIGYVPEDRRQHGVILEMSIAENASLANLDGVSTRGLIDTRAERETAEQYVSQLRIKTASVTSDVGSLSGGNQQKVALARWLAIHPSVLMLDEPTQGVDVGSKAEIHAIMQSLAERGVAILMISSELPEVLGMSDRIAVMHGGTIVGVLSREEATQQKILAMALERDPAAGVLPLG